MQLWKMCRAFTAVNRPVNLILGRCLMNSANLKIKMSLYLNLPSPSGLLPELSWETVSVSHGGRSAPPNSESPNAAEECTLSSILEADAPSKYYLSSKTKDGILRRVTARGKTLPEPLRLALEA
jgi:hypothetical protein